MIPSAGITISQWCFATDTAEGTKVILGRINIGRGSLSQAPRARSVNDSFYLFPRVPPTHTLAINSYHSRMNLATVSLIPMLIC
ncbi:hypothetical protein RSOLAG1IB_09319 [Rhizoctonia solani AG-1 IB]|uniref:Uncharacterized protein n=1 Tax=Thanatephorus cucumeris (strain AG1-IB / isolate 7/3/14) TaxID=1108050 RepID=A0A0B7FQ59_THACB|nr:hypothetical protein RSOLAG1IB_09319 [Rhizoctonia solani AG-1 IB]